MNAKKDNQYYGKYSEYLVACILNKELPCLSAEQWGVAGEDGLVIEREAHEVATFLGPHRCFHILVMRTLIWCWMMAKLSN